MNPKGATLRPGVNPPQHCGQRTYNASNYREIGRPFPPPPKKQERSSFGNHRAERKFARLARQMVPAWPKGMREKGLETCGNWRVPGESAGGRGGAVSASPIFLFPVLTTIAIWIPSLGFGRTSRMAWRRDYSVSSTEIGRLGRIVHRDIV